MNGNSDGSTSGGELGANLIMQTINNLVSGGIKFNGPAIINFAGFRSIFNAIDGVRVDEETRSIHFDTKDEYHRTKSARSGGVEPLPVECGWTPGTPHPWSFDDGIR